ncbi:hypothetical protein AB0M43_01375 [Longispora sp. NPDC051575]|uniref:hypothetical protein n=1 Tax=Longispora sp. NPDC051575 TaxID=3154943 RepID=UPI0034413831
MHPHRWLADLSTQQEVVVEAAARFRRATADTRHPRVGHAERHLNAAQLVLVRVAGEPSYLGYVPLFACWNALIALLVGLAGAALGAAPGWTLAAAVAAVVVSYKPYQWLAYLWVVLLSMFRIARATRDRPPVELPPEPDGPRAVAEQTVELLLGARSTLARLGIETLDRHRLRAVARRPAVFHWLWTRDRTLEALSLADRHLCQAADAITVWLTPDEEDE